MMAEILAKETGVCKGKGGSMHIASPDINYFATSGILGASSVIANGAALTIKKRNERDRITAVFYGDGASNEGACFEALNLAAYGSFPSYLCASTTPTACPLPSPRLCTTPIFPSGPTPLASPRKP